MTQTTEQSLRERVARAIVKSVGNVRLHRLIGGDPWEEWIPEAAAAIAIVLEEASKVADEKAVEYRKAEGFVLVLAGKDEAAEEIATAIRALGDEG